MNAVSDLDALGFERLLALCQRDDKQALSLMVEKNIGLVYACLKRFKLSGRDGEELYQQGCLGLVRAIKRFDTRLGLRFSTYAVPLILGEIRQFLRDDSPVYIQRRDRDMFFKIDKAQALLRRTLDREPTVTELAKVLRMEAEELVVLIEQSPRTVSLDQPTDAQSGALPLMERMPDPQSENFIDRIILKDLLNRLPLLEQWLIYLRYEKGSTQAETARALHMTQVQVSRLEQKLRLKLIRQWRKE